MADIKTKQNDASVTAFLDGLADEKRRQDSYVVLDMMRKITGLEPKMWGDAISRIGSRGLDHARCWGERGRLALLGLGAGAGRFSRLDLGPPAAWVEYPILAGRAGGALRICVAQSRRRRRRAEHRMGAVAGGFVVESRARKKASG